MFSNLSHKTILVFATLVILAVGLLFFIAWDGEESTASGGITGLVLLGPTCPVEQYPPDPNCADRPYETTLAITTPDDTEVVKEFRSDSSGKFTAGLKPGWYRIRSAAAANILPYCASTGEFEVRESSYTEVTVSCDSGIR